jgi:4-amino-4-deoxy-L-arabinose transferase-like glycosyltransferase
MTVRLTPFWHGSRVSARNLVLITVIAVAALLCGIGIGKNPFWDDEAETALVARGIVEYGSRSAWTGENVVAFRGGFDLDDHLVQVSVPPLQYYLTAASFLVFGEGTVSGRFPFLLAGILTLWLVHRWTATYLGPDFPSWLPSLLLALNVPFLLFIAQCRYYALVMMFTAALLWGWAEIGRHARPALICVGGGAAIVGLFEANYMDAAALAVACAVGSTAPSKPSLPYCHRFLLGALHRGPAYAQSHPDGLEHPARHDAANPTSCHSDPMGASRARNVRVFSRLHYTNAFPAMAI